MSRQKGNRNRRSNAFKTLSYHVESKISKFLAYTKGEKRASEMHYVPYGDSNTFPQNLVDLINSSPTLQQGVELTSKFLYGDGIDASKAFLEYKINDSQTIEDLLEDITNEVPAFSSFVVHVQVNGAFEIVGIKCMPFEQIRKGSEDDQGNVDKYYLIRRYEERDYAPKDFKDKSIVKEYYAYHRDVKQFHKELAEVGTISNHPGYIAYVYKSKASGRFYPKPQWFSAMEDAIAEAEVKHRKRNDITGGFTGKLHITHFSTAPLTDKEKGKIIEETQEFMGEEGSQTMITFARNKESAPLVQPISHPELSKLYEYAERSASETIMKIFQIPQVLYGIPTAGKLGSTQEIEEAIAFTQRMVINRPQQMIERVLTELVSHMKLPEEIKRPDKIKIKNLSLKGFVEEPTPQIGEEVEFEELEEGEKQEIPSENKMIPHAATSLN